MASILRRLISADALLARASKLINLGTDELTPAGMSGFAEAEFWSTVDLIVETPEPVYVNKYDGTCGGKSPCYTSIQAAINAASTGTVIAIAQGTYAESITLNESKLLTLQGGWNSSYDAQTSNTTFIKAPKALQGALSLEMVTIKP